MHGSGWWWQMANATFLKSQAGMHFCFKFVCHSVLQGTSDWHFYPIHVHLTFELHVNTLNWFAIILIFFKGDVCASLNMVVAIL